MRHIFQHGRLNHPAFPAAAAQQLAALLHGIVNRLLDPFGIVLRNDRPDERFLIARIAGLNTADRRDELLAKRIVDLAMHQNPLHADAALARLVVAAEDTPLDRVRDIGIALDDHGRVAAQLERHVLLAGPIAQLPATLAGEPVKLSLLIRSSSTSAAESLDFIGRIENAPAGKSVSARISPRMSALIGV